MEKLEADLTLTFTKVPTPAELNEIESIVKHLELTYGMKSAVITPRPPRP